MKLHTALHERDQMQGNPAAPITLIEYGDYECPYCGEAYPLVKELQDYFGENLLFVFRNFPLTSIHLHAMDAARIAEAAAMQHKFWPVHDLIFENQDALLTEQLLSYARYSGADTHKVLADMNSPSVINKIDNDIESGARSGVNGTPTFFVNGVRYDADISYRTMRDELARILKKR